MSGHAGFARGRLLTVVLALLGVQLAWFVAPAYACGCGAMVPDGQHNVYVNRESSVVRWDGGEEQIVMSLTVAGDSPEAAWIMPVPNRATVRLGDRALFDQLGDATAPEYREREYFWPRSGDWPFDIMESDGASGGAPRAGAPSVDVVGRERLGPFDVARLTATDSGALGDWLDDNGFELPDRLDRALRPYVEQDWEYVAIRLAPEESASGSALGGTLDPLHLTFRSDEPVYPMRLSKLATTPQSLGLYVLAEHRMEPRSAIGGDEPEVTYAGRVTAPTGALAELTDGGTDFLTALDQNFPEPSLISGDHELRRTATDAAYRKVIYMDDMATLGGVPVWLISVGGGLALLAIKAVAVTIVLRRNSRKTPPLPPIQPMPPYGHPVQQYAPPPQQPVPPTQPPGPIG
ncbi:hypothetical protein SGFS_081070 [Streptomyces graminofaciens]|uniref:DUF2330 domain-containing protein n=1 Tax=Streptomyces graminofaciens TaxID=68212 RepID=A0ABN5VUB4_9ACTN|nr:DUF2330 domain-containing protein [Streptomyces graminofaciens]BBC36813.1 hypothetical protein SGFS_081070 [Streptomyces graminofaciens]